MVAKRHLKILERLVAKLPVNPTQEQIIEGIMAMPNSRTKYQLLDEIIWAQSIFGPFLNTGRF